jgi:hypothetical protein
LPNLKPSSPIRLNPPSSSTKSYTSLYIRGGVRGRVVHYEAVWRTILQQAANEGKEKLFFKVRDKA